MSKKARIISYSMILVMLVALIGIYVVKGNSVNAQNSATKNNQIQTIQPVTSSN